MSPFEFQKRMTEALRLRESEQDWGTVNAQPDRVPEFIQYFERAGHSVPPERRDLFVYNMTELVMESAAERLATAAAPPEELVVALRRFWRTVQDHHAGRMLIESIQRDALEGDGAQIGLRRLGHLLQTG
jgi:hypothetical protein